LVDWLIYGLDWVTSKISSVDVSYKAEEDCQISR